MKNVQEPVHYPTWKSFSQSVSTICHLAADGQIVLTPQWGAAHTRGTAGHNTNYHSAATSKQSTNTVTQSAAHLKMCTVIIRFAKIHLHANCTKMRDLQKDSFSIFITNVPCLLPNQISKLCHGEGIALMMLQYYTSLPIVLLQTRTLWAVKIVWMWC